MQRKHRAYQACYPFGTGNLRPVYCAGTEPLRYMVTISKSGTVDIDNELLLELNNTYEENHLDAFRLERCEIHAYTQSLVPLKLFDPYNIKSNYSDMLIFRLRPIQCKSHDSCR